LADPLRLLLALAIVLISASFLGAARSEPGWQIVFLTMYFAAGILIAIRARSAQTKWKNLTEQVSNVSHGLDVGEWKSILESANRTSKKYVIGAYVLAAITCGWAAHHLYFVVHDAVAHTEPHIAMPLESMLATTALIIGLQHWLNKRAYQVSPQPATIDAVLADFKRHWLRRVLAVVTVILGLCVLRISNVIANYQAAVIANCDAMRPYCVPPPIAERVGLPQWWPWNSLPGASALLPSGKVEQWWWDQAPTTWIVAGAAVALLILVSLWGWVDNKSAVGCTVIGAAVAGFTQWVLDDPGVRDWGVFDVLPTLMWMVLMGAVVTWLPIRRTKYGEADVPELTGANSAAQD
jgi:hypothetical protein